MAEKHPALAGLRVSLHVDIPSDVTYIERVVELVRRPCIELDFNNRQLGLNIPVALSEALSNAILRANGEDPEKRVQVHADIDASTLVLEIVDEGCRFDLGAKTRNPTDAENLELEDGRGLFLMRKLMDSVERFDASPGADNGNMVRLTLTRA